jgi:hypothetical protein
LLSSFNVNANKDLHKVQRAFVGDNLMPVVPEDPVPKEAAAGNEPVEAAVFKQENSFPIELPIPIKIGLAPLERRTYQPPIVKGLDILHERALAGRDQLGSGMSLDARRQARCSQRAA